jgi:hypothetical protein
MTTDTIELDAATVDYLEARGLNAPAPIVCLDERLLLVAEKIRGARDIIALVKRHKFPALDDAAALYLSALELLREDFVAVRDGKVRRNPPANSPCQHPTILPQ